MTRLEEKVDVLAQNSAASTEVLNKKMDVMMTEIRRVKRCSPFYGR
jgi:hypothetical protein